MRKTALRSTPRARRSDERWTQMRAQNGLSGQVRVTGMQHDTAVIAKRQRAQIAAHFLGAGLARAMQGDRQIRCCVIRHNQSVESHIDRNHMRVARALRNGTVWINEIHTFSPHVAFGGRKQSGIGIENALEGLAEYTAVQTLAINRAQASDAGRKAA